MQDTYFEQQAPRENSFKNPPEVPAQTSVTNATGGGRNRGYHKRVCGNKGSNKNTVGVVETKDDVLVVGDIAGQIIIDPT